MPVIVLFYKSELRSTRKPVKVFFVVVVVELLIGAVGASRITIIQPLNSVKISHLILVKSTRSER